MFFEANINFSHFHQHTSFSGIWNKNGASQANTSNSSESGDSEDDSSSEDDDEEITTLRSEIFILGPRIKAMQKQVCRTIMKKCIKTELL